MSSMRPKTKLNLIKNYILQENRAWCSISLSHSLSHRHTHSPNKTEEERKTVPGRGEEGKDLHPDCMFATKPGKHKICY